MFSSLTHCCTLFLILFFYQAYGQYKRSLHLRVTPQKEFRCIDLSCQPFATMQVNHRLACLQRCIAQESCRTVNFISVNKTCELFFETTATHGALLLNLNAYVMVVSDGSRFPEVTTTTTTTTTSVTTTTSTSTTSTTTTTTSTTTTSTTTTTTTTTTVTTTTSVQLPSQCLNHTVNTDGTRKIDSGQPIRLCDSPSPFGASPTWVRFSGAAGTRLVDYVIPTNSCHTDAVGWYTGSAPNLGLTVSGTVCFSWSGNTCLWSTSIQMTNCDGFFVYSLPVTPNCNLRYCTV